MPKNSSTKSKVAPHSNQATTNLSYILNPLTALRAIWSPDNGLTASEAGTLSALVIHADAEGKCWPNQERIATCAKLKRTATKEALTRLEKKNLIHRMRHRFTGTHYQLIPSAICVLSPRPLNGHESGSLNGHESGSLNGHESGSLNGHESGSLNGHKLPMERELPMGTTQPLSPPPTGKGRGRGREGERERENEPPKSQYSLEECEQYAASLKGIKYPDGFAKTIYRTGQDDKKIAKFLTDEASKAEKQAKTEAAKEAEQRAQLLWMVEQIKANGGPKQDWERKILIAAKELVV